MVGLIQLQQRPTFLKNNSLAEYTGSLLSDEDSLALEPLSSHRESYSKEEGTTWDLEPTQLGTPQITGC